MNIVTGEAKNYALSETSYTVFINRPIFVGYLGGDFDCGRRISGVLFTGWVEMVKVLPFDYAIRQEFTILVHYT